MTQFGSIPANSDLELPDQTSVYVATTGGTYTIPDNIGRFIMDPASLLATFTLTLPANPTNGWIMRIISSKAVSIFGLNANAGQTIVGAPTSLLLGGYCTMLWVNAKSTWYRCG